LLPDPYGLLKGGGKQVRYLHLGGDDALPKREILELIEAALSLPEGRQAKQDLLRAVQSRGAGGSRRSND
jgi:hypothetical protein